MTANAIGLSGCFARVDPDWGLFELAGPCDTLVPSWQTPAAKLPNSIHGAQSLIADVFFIVKRAQESRRITTSASEYEASRSGRLSPSHKGVGY
jgi:hypothetical protein